MNGILENRFYKKCGSKATFFNVSFEKVRQINLSILQIRK